MSEAIRTHAPRFLVLRGGAIGDFIATLPVLQALRTQWPAATIEIWGYPHIADLAVAVGLAQAVVSLDRAEMARFFVPEPSFTDAQVAAVRSFDLIFNYLHDPVGQVRSNLLLAGAKQVLSGSPIIKRGPAVPFLLEPLQALAIYETNGTPALDFPAALRARGRARLQALGLRGRPMVVHPGSGSPTKNWPAERFIEILRRLRAAGRETVAVLGEADVAEAAVLARELPELPVLAGLTLTELAATLAECGAFLGNDSGIAHLAAAVGLPTTAIFGPSDADIWAPRGRGGVTVLRAPEKELERLTVAAVWATLAQA
ncbi:MAG TPA: glycosyltransferase family 9 protein [Kiritimatiellia bacterium]|nr:glycosyltransferase family 9 protein [Kiritimatiellia bacterium]